MALTMTRAGNFNLGGNSTYARYVITATPSTAVHNLDDIAYAIDADAGWEVTKVESGLYYTEYSIRYTGSQDNNRMKLISVAANITDNSDGRTVFRFPTPTTNFGNNTIFFQLMGTGSSSPTDTAQAHINIGSERNGIKTGWFDVIYEDPPQFGGSGDWRPVDLGLANNPQVVQQFAMAGFPASGSMNTPTVGGPYYTIQWTDSDNAARRFDADWLDNGMTGNFSMGVFVNGEGGNTNSNPHVLASNYTLLSGTAINGRLPAETNLYADSDSTYTPQGAFVNQFPQVYLQDLRADDTDQFSILRSRGPVQANFGTFVDTNHGLVINNYPFNRYKAIALGNNNDNNNVTSQTPTTFLDPQPIRGSKFDQIRQNVFHAARGNIFASSGYTVTLNNPNGTRHNLHGFAIRRRNATSLVSSAIEGNTTYQVGNKDVFNNELEYYAWELDSENSTTGRHGYTLDWYLRPNTSNTGTGGNIVPEDKILYTGTYDVWQGVPGANAPVMMTKTPYNADTPPERAVSDTIVQEISSQFSTANVFQLQWTANLTGTPGIGYNNAFTEGSLGRDMTGDQFYSTLSNGVYQVVNYWSGLTQAQKITNHATYCDSGGIFNSLVDHDAVLASANGSVCDISDNSSSSFVFNLITTSGGSSRTVTKGSGAIQTVQLSHGIFDFDGIGVDCRAANGDHVFVNGRCQNLYRSDSEDQVYSMDGNTQMNGDYLLADSRGDLLNPAAIYYQFRDCAIAPGGSLSFTRSGSNSRPVYVIGAPAGATYNTGITPVQNLVITRPTVAGETSTASGRLSIHSSNGDFLTENVTGVVSGSTVTYSVNSVDVSGLTGNVVVVWTDAQSTPLRSVVDVGNAGGTTSLTLTPNTVTQISGSIPSGLSVEFAGVNSEAGYDSDSDILFIGVRGAVGDSVPSAAETALWLTTQLNGTRDYNRLIAESADNVSAYRQVGVSNAAIDASKIKFVPGEATTQSLGYIEVTGTGGATRTFVSGGETYYVNITADPPQGLSPETLGQVLTDRGVTLSNLQSISIGVPI